MKKTIDKKRDLERKLVLKSETLRRLDLRTATGGRGEGESPCYGPASCGDDTCVCTGTFPDGFG